MNTKTIAKNYPPKKHLPNSVFAYQVIDEVDWSECEKPNPQGKTIRKTNVKIRNELEIPFFPKFIYIHSYIIYLIL